MSTMEAQRELCFTSIAELGRRFRTRELSPIELTEAMLARCGAFNEQLHVYITVTAELALEQARQAERELAAGHDRGPLHGIPIALKDNIETRGIRTSCASLVNPDWVPERDATVYERLRETGAVLTGKANLYEYAFSMTPAFPQPPNPWRHDRMSAGSSSGSGVAVAAGLASGAIGSDTGGSGRAPANVNGVVGFKATYGRVSRHGVVPLSYSLDHVTVLTRSVLDSALMLQAISSYDERDPASSRVVVPDFAAHIRNDVRGLRVGYARGYTYQDIDPDVIAVMADSLRVLRALGCTVEEVTLPYLEHCVTLQTAVMLPEAAVIHYDNLRGAAERLGDSALMRLDLGNVIPATSYIRAQQVRELMRDAYRALFRSYDVIVGPAMPARAGRADSWMLDVDGVEVDLRAVGPEYTGLYNLLGLPVIVVPAGFSSEGTPIGLQLGAAWFEEPRLVQLAHAFEQATHWHTLHPPDPVAALSA